MSKVLRITTVVAALLGLVTSCSLLPEISAEELERIVQRDGVAFDAQSIPSEVIDRLADHRVALIGETHFLREHRELVVELLRQLHGRGYRQFLFEWTQAADWLLADFVEDGGLEPDWAPPLSIGGDMLSAIRDFNRTLPESEWIQVHGVDVTLQDYGGGEAFQWSLGRLAEHLSHPGPLSVLLQGQYDTPERQTAQLEALQADLSAGRSDLVASWGEPWYDRVIEMVEVELSSVPIRAIRQSNYDKSVRLREEAIKRLVDRRLQALPQGTLINMGSTHAQKQRLRGTDVEWLGDYLVHKSEAAGGSVIVVEVSAAHIVSVPGSDVPDGDLAASPENEMLRVMNQIWPDQIVFLPLDDPLFSRERIPMNFGDVYVGAPKRYYDVFVLLPQAQRLPSSG